MKQSLLFTILIFFTLSCSKNEDTGLRKSGEITLSTRLYFNNQTYYSKAYSFSKGDFVNFPGEKADLVATAKTDAQGVKTGVSMNSDQLNLEPFIILGTFASTSEAQTFFDQYKVADDTAWVDFVKTLQAGQVILYRSYSGHYAKLLIENITIPDADPTTGYVEVKLKFVYQPKDTNTFE
jgi:hypothetical protein